MPYKTKQQKNLINLCENLLGGVLQRKKYETIRGIGKNEKQIFPLNISQSLHQDKDTEKLNAL